MSDPLHYMSMSLTNVRAFGNRQTLNLAKDGKPSRWCVVLGENGVGKTTLMQALAVMRPKPSFGKTDQPQDVGAEAKAPGWVEPEFAAYENDEIEGFVRHGDEVEAHIEATLADPDGKAISIGYRIVMKAGELVAADPEPFQHTLIGPGPLIIAYSAFRLPGGDVDVIGSFAPTQAIFDQTIKLVDADKVIEKLDYALLSARRDDNKAEIERRERLSKKMTEVIAALIPDANVADIDMGGAKFPGAKGVGMRVRTPSGMMPLGKLSLGYQTVVAWVVDLAWRLFSHFPDSEDPFQESAIVLVDEIDLHLHPAWQRIVREQLLAHFPRIQFVVSTHSPISAQESIFAGDPLSVVRWDAGEAVILFNPIRDRAARLDQVVSEAFDLASSRPSPVEMLLLRRRELIRKDELTPEETELLTDLNNFAYDLQSGTGNYEAELDDLMAKVAPPAPG